HFKTTTRRYGADILPHRFSAMIGDTEVKKIGCSRIVQTRSKSFDAQKLLKFRSEGDAAIVPQHVKWLDSESIACGKEATAICIEENEREHSFQLLERVTSPHLYSAKDGPRVGKPLDLSS